MQSAAISSKSRNSGNWHSGRTTLVPLELPNTWNEIYWLHARSQNMAVYMYNTMDMMN